MITRCSIAFLLLCSSLTIIDNVNSEITSDQMKYFYQSVLSPATYDKRVRPGQASDPVRVRVSMYIIHLFDLDQESQSVKVSMYFRQLWDDPRLAHNGDGMMVGGGDLSDMIWKPDTMFSSSSEGVREETTLPNTFVRISPNGSVFTSVKLTQDIHCQHKLRSFPMDSMVCKIIAESYAHSATDLIYEWIPGSLLAPEDLEVSQFNLNPEIHNYTNVVTLSTGNFTTLTAALKLERTSLPYLIKYFIPLMMTTILSMIPITDHKNKSLAVLTSFLLTTILTVTTNVQVVPKGAAITAFDAFGLICITFSAISLVFTLRKSAESEGSTYKLSEREEKIEQQMKKLMPIGFVSFLLIFVICITCF